MRSASSMSSQSTNDSTMLTSNERTYWLDPFDGFGNPNPQMAIETNKHFCFTNSVSPFCNLLAVVHHIFLSKGVNWFHPPILLLAAVKRWREGKELAREQEKPLENHKPKSRNRKNQSGKNDPKGRKSTIPGTKNTQPKTRVFLMSFSTCQKTRSCRFAWQAWHFRSTCVRRNLCARPSWS